MAEIIPYIYYRDVPAALQWLSTAFGFIEEMRHPTATGMHAQMTFQGQRIMMGQGGPQWRAGPPMGGTTTMGVFVYLDDVDALYARAKAAGAEVDGEPHDEGYGRTVTIRDLDGHPLNFTVPPKG